MTPIWSTTCVNVGPQSAELAEMGMIVTFGSDAPSELAAFCVSIEAQPVNGAITPGVMLHIGDQAYLVTAVGEVAQTNLGNLGHVTFNFDGAQEPSLPGTIHVQGSVPEVHVGTPFALMGA